MVLGCSRFPISYPLPKFQEVQGVGGVVAKCDRQQQRAPNLLINLKIISFYTIYYSTILQ